MSLIARLNDVPGLKNRIATISILRRADMMSQARVDGIIKGAVEQLAKEAVKGLPGEAIIVRDLVASDMPGYSTDLWAETTGTSVGYATTTGGDGTAIADDTWIAVWGVRLLTPITTESAGANFIAQTAPINGLRLSIGSTIIALWNLLPISPVVFPDAAEAVALDPVEGFTESPLVISKNQTFKVEEYGTTTAADPYEWQLLGAVAEKRGKSIG